MGVGNKKWYQGPNGDISALRVMVVPAGYIGMLGFIAGTVAMFMNNPQATAAMGSSVGLITLAVGAKAWQRGKE